jgi:RNA polymerase sigma-70 factor (ECF subfamily)
MNSQEINKEAFSQLIESNQGIIHKITMLYANNRADREDLFQEICLQLWKSVAGFRKEARFQTWMYRVAINTAINGIRRQNSIPAFEPLDERRQVPDVSNDDMEQVNLLYQSISLLNPIDRAIILLWLEEKNYEEIASIMGISKSNVSVKLVRIKRKLEELNNDKEHHHGR